ncbi:hypothetical protein EsH8_V_001193 [Colletotrichum jinshuiense]
MGAENLCFVSRLGMRTEAGRELAAELQANSVTVKAYECNAVHTTQLQQTLSRRCQEMPPIRGVLQCAMVLRNCTFGNMDFTQWTEAAWPKIQASWNIQSLLHDNEIDFFIMLASFTGYFGNAGQTNYGAGCTFQDALAHYRHSEGLPAVSLDLGIIHDVGVLAETNMTDNLRDRTRNLGIREQQLQDLIRIAIQGQITAAGVVEA